MKAKTTKVVLNLPPQLAQSVAREAGARGVSVERYIETMLIWHAPIESPLWKDGGK